MTELWFRNPLPYMSELKEVMSEFNIVWDIAYLSHWDRDPFIFMCMNFGLIGNWRFMVVYGIERYAEMRDNHNNLVGNYPVWDASMDNPQLLIDYVSNPEYLIHGKQIVEEQEHRVIISNLDVKNKHEQLYEIADLQKNFPDVKIHIYNTFSYQAIFGLGFYSGDVHPKDAAGIGKVILPSGKQVKYTEFEDAGHWIEMLGFSWKDLQTDRSLRIKYNIVSATWAAIHFNELPSFKRKLSYIPISSAAGLEVILKRTPMMTTGLAIQEGDKKACDFCTLWKTCRYFREGSVCMMPGSDFESIAKALQTRDAHTIARGIGDLLAVNVERIGEAREAEQGSAELKKKFIESLDDEDDKLKVARVLADGKNSGVIDPELTKLIDSTVKQAVALATLYKIPEGKRKVIITLGAGSSAAVTTSGAESHAQLTAGPAEMRELAAQAVSALEKAGIPREDITEEHVNEWLRQNIVEGVVEE